MKTNYLAVLCACILVLDCAVIGWVLLSRNDEYRQGYGEGFERGYKQGFDRASLAARPPGGDGAVPTATASRARAIVIVRAWYGDGDKRFCDLTDWAAAHVNGRNSESIPASNEICGDPAFGVVKTLNVEYKCGNETRKVAAGEGGAARLNCY